MTRKLRRRTAEPPRPREYIPLGAIIVLLGMASGVWQFARPALVDRLARSSLGNRQRNELVTEALAERYPRRRPDREADRYLFSRNDAYAAGVVWVTRHEYDLQDNLSQTGLRAEYAFADGDLELCGRVRCPYYSGEVAMDRDDDGNLEAIIGVTPVTMFGTQPHLPEAVIRLRGDVNELVGMVAIDTQGLNARLATVWQTRGGPGQDLVFFPYTLRRLPSGAWQRADDRPLVDLMWTAPGGALTPRTPVESPRVRVWTPADGKPIEFPADQDPSEVCQELWSQAFGNISPLTTQPASDPTTREVERE